MKELEFIKIKEWEEKFDRDQKIRQQQENLREQKLKQKELERLKSYEDEQINNNLSKGLEKFEIGYSDHCEGIEVAKQSLEYGVDWIEKHFTIDKNLPGRDNKFSILPDEMSELNNYIKLREETSQFLGRDYQDIESETRENYTGRWDMKVEDTPLTEEELKEKMSESYLSEE